MLLTLPYPTRVNHYWRHFRGRTLISQEGRAYREHVCALLGGNGPRQPPTGGRIALGMEAFPPDRRKRDLDNLQKPVLDALEHSGVYEDDSQIDLLVTRRRERTKGGKLIVRIDAFPLSVCPVCGAPVNPENN